MAWGNKARKERERIERGRRDAKIAANMSDGQLILAMLLEMDAADTQAFARGPLGAEARKRCPYDPYAEGGQFRDGD